MRSAYARRAARLRDPDHRAFRWRARARRLSQHAAPAVLNLSLGFGVGGLAGLSYGALIARYIGGIASEYVPVRED